MRLDKYLKVSRLVKRRTLANEAISQSRVLLNGKAVKPAAEVKAGDKIELHFGTRVIQVEVIDTSDRTSKVDASQMYRVISE